VLRLLVEHNAKARAQQKARRKAERDRAPADDEPDQDVPTTGRRSS
jgi:hypothetical protein